MLHTMQRCHAYKQLACECAATLLIGACKAFCKCFLIKQSATDNFGGVSAMQNLVLLQKVSKRLGAVSDTGSNKKRL